MATTRAVIQRLGALATYRYGVDSYDSTKLGLGPLMVQNNGGAEASYAGPMPIAIVRPSESPISTSTSFPWSMRWQATAAGDIDWVFMIDSSAAAATRKLSMYTFDRRASAWTWVGYTTITNPSSGNMTVRGFSMTYDLYTTGTVTGSSGNAGITGSGTAWSASRIPAGCRIGFGSTDPTQITTWYVISSIGSDTAITLTATLSGNVSGAYVIEDLRAVLAMTSGAGTSGLFVVKGLYKDFFTTNGANSIAAATNADNIRACYWLADAATDTNNTPIGLAVAAKTSWTNQLVYIVDGTSTPSLYVYNLRAALTLASGKDTTSLVVKTGTIPTALAGTPSQLNNLELATTNHGPGIGKPCLYFTTTTRMYRSYDVSTITTGSTTWLADAMIETPPGGINTYPTAGNFQTLAYAASIDKFVITQTTSSTGYRNYVTQYRTDSGPMDRVWGVDARQTDVAAADGTTTPIPTDSGQTMSVYCDTGMCYLAGVAATAATNRVYAAPFGADWEYTGVPNNTKSCLVLPAISTADAVQYTNIILNDVQVVGGNTGYNLGLSTEPLRVWYRTAGILDDSGAWTLADSTGVLTKAAGTKIQLRIEFRTIGVACLPARVCAAGVAYTDIGVDVHFQPSVGKSSAASTQFAWRFATAFGGAVPALRLRLYDSVTNTLLVDDNTTAPVGLFESTTNGGTSWSTYNQANNISDKGNETTYIRYTPASLGSGIKVRALLTLQ